MPAVFAYTRALFHEIPADLEKTKETGDAFRQERLSTLIWAGWFVDTSETRGTPFFDRPAGNEMSNRLQRGDRVVLPSVARSFKNLQDLLFTVDVWRDRGIIGHLLDCELNTDIDAVKLAMLRFVSAVQQQQQGERTRESLARRKKVNRAVNGFPGYGNRLVGAPGKRRRVPDLTERRIMQYIARHHLAGFSWNAIYFHFLEHGIRTRSGKEWSMQRIRRACVAELRRRATEEEEKLGDRK